MKAKKIIRNNRENKFLVFMIKKIQFKQKKMDTIKLQSKIGCMQIQYMVDLINFFVDSKIKGIEK